MREGSGRERGRGKIGAEERRETSVAGGGGVNNRERVNRERESKKKKERVTRVDLVAIGNGVFGEDVGS